MYVSIHQLVYFKYVQFNIRQLYLNKSLFKIPSRTDQDKRGWWLTNYQYQKLKRGYHYRSNRHKIKYRNIFRDYASEFNYLYEMEQFLEKHKLTQTDTTWNRYFEWSNIYERNWICHWILPTRKFQAQSTWLVSTSKHTGKK